MSEFLLQQQVVRYIEAQYPGALVRSDMAAAKRSFTQQRYMRAVQSGRGWPDLGVYEPRGRYAGLFVELKKDGASPFRRDGSLKADAHVQEQAAMLAALEQRGFRAVFATGFDEAKAVIDGYMQQEPLDPGVGRG